MNAIAGLFNGRPCDGGSTSSADVASVEEIRGRSGEARRIVMLVANEFIHDTRVYKQARSLTQWGCEVHVIAMARHDLSPFEQVDGIRVHRLAARTSRVHLLLLSLGCWWCEPLLARIVSPMVVLPSRSFSTAPLAGTARTAPAPRAHGKKPDAKPVEATWRAAMKNGLQSHPSLFRVAKRADAGLGAIPHKCTRAGIRAMRLCRKLLRAPVRLAKRMVPGVGALLALNYDMARRARALKPDVIQCHDLNTLLAGAMVKRLAKTPLVYDSHELFLERNIAGRSRWRDKLIWGPIEQRCIGRCDAIMSVADGICEHLAGRYAIAKPHLLRNVQPFEPPAPRSRLLSDELGIPHETAVVIYPGAITINRGLEAMIESAAHLNGAAYVVMGYARNPKYLAQLKARAAELGVLGSKVYFRDAVPIDQVVRYTASADLGIVPTQNVCLSYYYEASNKIFHCLMAGVPLAMSDHPEKRLIVEQYKVGVLFDETRPQAIAEAVNTVLSDREGLARMREACLTAARVLNWEQEELKLRSIFGALLEGPSRPMLEVKFQHDGPPAAAAVSSALAVSRHDA